MRVPGSEKYDSRMRDREAIAATIAPSLKLYPLVSEIVSSIDPLTYEVVRHRIWSITDAMGDALKRMSGSLPVTDANDFDVAVTDPYGAIVQVGPYNTQLVASISLAIQWTLSHRSANPGIHAGDMFLCNDPWVGGGLHQNDVSLFAPLFHADQLFGWTAAVAHQADLGGVSAGSWTPRAEDVFWESLPTPPMKIVEGGELRQDLEDVYLRRSRVPQLVALDLRAKMGANLLGQERLRAVISRYGPDVVQAVMQRHMHDAETRLRAKLATAPDGSWGSVIYQEQSKQGDRGLHAIRVTLTKSGDQMQFDFTGTDPQSGMINCTYAGLYGGVMSAVMPVLCGDIPWAAGGLVRCIEIRTKQGTLNNATFPAGVGKGSVASSWATTDAVTHCLSQMLDVTPVLRGQVQSVCSGTWDLCVLAGLDQRGQPFATGLLDAMGGGFGAGADHDGVDTGGLMFIPMGRMPDVEMNEFRLPILYLWRREETDSGGPGKYRGGVGGSLAIAVHDSPGRIAQVVSGSGKAVPMNVGLAGGYPGNTQRDVTIRGSNASELFAAGAMPSTLAQLDGQVELKSSEEETHLDPGDVHFMLWQAGGGYGDPLLRDPLAVAGDVQELKVSPEAAHTVYGVVINDSGVDAEETARRRRQIREERRGRARG